MGVLCKGGGIVSGCQMVGGKRGVRVAYGERLGDDV